MYMYTHACKHTRYIHVHAYIHIRTCTTLAHIMTRMHAYKRAHTHSLTHTHTHTHTHTSTHTHTHTQKNTHTSTHSNNTIPLSSKCNNIHHREEWHPQCGRGSDVLDTHTCTHNKRVHCLKSIFRVVGTNKDPHHDPTHRL